MSVRFNRPVRAVGCLLVVASAFAWLTGCSVKSFAPTDEPTPAVTAPVTTTPAQPTTPAKDPATPATKPAETAPKPAESKPGGTTGGVTGEKAPRPDVKVIADPNETTLMVNKIYRLPDGYVPADLVEPQVRFIFAEKVEKRLMRQEASTALEQMFAAAEADGIFLAGVSGYRSYETQSGLFNHYVQTQGEETARRYSAEPGHSEHQTGLAMDISGSTGACAADDCFAGTPEADWLAAHAAEHGFIIRYPKGKEAITGYAYEPWHARYVGKALAQELTEKGLTLEEYYAAKQ